MEDKTILNVLYQCYSGIEAIKNLIEDRPLLRKNQINEYINLNSKQLEDNFQKLLKDDNQDE